MSAITSHLYRIIFSGCLMVVLNLATYAVLQAQENDRLSTLFEYIEERYYSKQETDALDITDEQLEKAIEQKFTREEYLTLLRWKVRIHHRLRETTEADSVLKHMFSLNDDLDYERFEDKQEHFRSFFNKTLKEYEDNVVFVNKYKEDVDTAPAAITIYTKEDIEELGARSLVDLLRLTPGFAETGDNNERNFGTRGVYGTTVQHILFLINGHRVNDLLTSSNAPDWFSLDYVEQIEIMRGPGSALYGGNAFSGVINIITKSAKTFSGSTFNARAGSAQLFSDFLDGSNHFYKLNYQYGVRLKNRDKLYLSGTFRYSGGSKYTYNASDVDLNNPQILPDIRTTDTIPPNSNGSEYINRYLPSYNFLANYVGSKLDLTFNAQSSVFAIHRPNSGNLWTMNDNNAVRTRSRKDQRQFIKLNYDLSSTRSVNSSLALKFSFDHFLKDLFIHKYDNFDVNPSDTSLVRLKGDEFRWTSSLEYTTRRFSILGNTHESFTIMGVQASLTDWFYNYMVAPEDQSRFHFDPATNFFEKQQDNENTAAYFFQTSQHLINKRLIATAGFRLNYHPIYSNFQQIRWGDEISPRISMVYISKQGPDELVPFKIKLLYNSAFLPPAFLYRRGGISGFRSVQSLASQKIESVEFSIFGEIIKNLNYSINHFTNKIDQFILRQSDIYENEVNTRRLSGWEFNIEHISDTNLKGWATKAFLNFSTTRLKTSSTTGVNVLKTLVSSNFDDSLLYYYPTFTLSGGLQTNYTLPNKDQDKLQMSLSFNYQGKTRILRSVGYNTSTNQWQSGLSNPETISGVPPIFNINLRRITPQFIYGLSIHNLFNTRYQLPSVVSRTGQMLGEKRTILLTFEYRIGDGKS